ncbi:TPA: winged helix-turn-helix transcriptional regulator [Streptococcus suis]|uniref:ArsR/SmtB family transcription factor n=2 Tax=Streptococcus suis TaxID=1307 RepID=UPI000CF5A1A5|nr:winged helix-turn-helix domain-containing protein [Streptococcus suis]MBY4954916.1 winged helix-turn-helix domain-containing protein [Streptococcus suis]MBY4969677.1 winged helix-turn-helix domain-containing protein [Streptococcus suis]MBY4981412.1 winged helix-turn-helix domain-containing protein [Streptococcus suis]MBY4992117.1 winged helix-turn-helix domain-containing protein [Streptococcus suis]MBY5007519.1 winged helix-turn-helix domain-containing protein [Streptococcus suis]
MTERERLVDYIFSFDLINDPIQETSEYKDVEKVTSEEVLGIIRSFQMTLMKQKNELLPYVNDEYNLLSAIFFHNPSISTFADYCSYIEDLTLLQLSEIVSVYILQLERKNEEISIETIISSDFSETNKWRLTTILFSYEISKKKMMGFLEQTWRIYNQYLEQLLETLSNEEKQSKHLLLESDDLYQVVFSDYINKESFEEVREKFVLPFLVHKMLYITAGNFSCVGIGYQTYHYWSLLKRKGNINQRTREQVLKTLVDPTRFGILKFINEGIWSNKIISEKFGISSSAVTYQLKYLMEHQIIFQDTETRKYSINKPLLSQVLLDLKEELEL